MNSKTRHAAEKLQGVPAPVQSLERAPAIVATVVTGVVAYQLFRTAQQTGNYEGMWFSLAHTLLVAVATVVALRAR